MLEACYLTRSLITRWSDHGVNYHPISPLTSNSSWPHFLRFNFRPQGCFRFTRDMRPRQVLFHYEAQMPLHRSSFNLLSVMMSILFPWKLSAEPAAFTWRATDSRNTILPLELVIILIRILNSVVRHSAADVTIHTESRNYTVITLDYALLTETWRSFGKSSGIIEAD